MYQRCAGRLRAVATCAPSACRAMPVAVATLTESAPGAIAMRTWTSAAASAASPSPSPSAPTRSATGAIRVRRHEIAQQLCRRARRQCGDDDAGVADAARGPSGHGSRRAHGTHERRAHRRPQRLAVQRIDARGDRAARRRRRTPARCAGCCRRCRRARAFDDDQRAAGRGGGDDRARRPAAAGRSATARQPRWKWKPPIASMTGARRRRRGDRAGRRGRRAACCAARRGRRSLDEDRADRVAGERDSRATTSRPSAMKRPRRRTRSGSRTAR